MPVKRHYLCSASELIDHAAGLLCESATLVHDRARLSIQTWTAEGPVMHAVVIRVTINDEESTIAQLREEIVPRVSQAPGFVTGYWARRGDSGLSFVVFDSEEAANHAKEMVQSIAAAGVTLENAEVREVVANA